MKWFHLLVLALALLALLWLVAPPASALEAWNECTVTNQAAAALLTPTRRLIVGPGETACYYFTGTENSDVFVVQSTSLIFFRPDAEGDGGGNAAIDVQRCLPGTVTYSANLCATILGAALDGTGGVDGTQTASVRVAKGTYVIINDTTAAADEAIVSIEAE